GWYRSDDTQDRPPCFIFARRWRSPKGYDRLFDLGAIEVNTAYLPVHPTTRSLVSQLVEAQRRFLVCPRLDSIDDHTIPAAVLLDLNEPQNLYTVSLT
ncbi:hypothetical protein V6O07_20665, partial [Arthrospira platensis SPKY2]